MNDTETGTGSDRGGRGIPAIAEAMGYVGGALALAALTALIVTFWTDMGMVGHVGVGVVLAAAGLTGGFILLGHEGEAAQRLARFLLFAGVAGVGFAAGFAVRDALYLYFPTSTNIPQATSDAAEWGWFAGALGVAIAGAAVWWRERSVLQHLVFGVGVAAAALLALPLVPWEGPKWGVGATLVAVALAWGALCLRDLIPPREAGYVLATLGLIGGILMMAFLDDQLLIWPLWLCLAASALLIWAGARIEHYGVLGVATVGLMIASGVLVGEYLGFGAGTAMVLIAIGFALLGAAVWMMRAREPETTVRRVATEVAGYLGLGLAVGGAGILFAQYWEELGVAGRIAVPAVGMLVALGSAFVLPDSDAGRARRLSQVLLAIGVVATGITSAMVARPVLDASLGVAPRDVWDPRETYLMAAGAVGATAAGATVWVLRRGAFTQIAFLGGLYMAFISAASWNDAIGQQRGGQPPLEFWQLSIVLVTLGVVWTVLGALEKMRPARTALVLGSMTMLQGLQMLAMGDEGRVNIAGALVGVALGVASIGASVWSKRATLLGFGAIEIMMFTVMIVVDRFEGRMGAPLALLSAGVMFIVLALVTAKLAPRLRRTPAVGKNTQ